MVLMEALEQLGSDYRVTHRDAFAGMLEKGEVSQDLVIAKGIDPQGDEPVTVKGSQVTFVGTSSKLDRDNDIIKAKGVDHANWMQRPVILASHDPRVRIGRGSSAELKGSRWIIQADYYPDDISPIAASMKAMLDWNLQHKGLKDVGAVYSIGFRSLSASFDRDRGGVDFDEIETLEYSDVSLASNPGARLLEAKAAGVGLDPIFDWAWKIRSEADSAPDAVNRDFAEGLCRLIEPSKGLKLVDLTAAHLEHLKWDAPPEPEPVKGEPESAGHPAALAFKAAKMGLDAAQTKELMDAAGWAEFSSGLGDTEEPTPAPEKSSEDWQKDLFLSPDNNGLPEKEQIKELVASVLEPADLQDMFVEKVAADTGHIPKT